MSRRRHREEYEEEQEERAKSSRKRPRSDFIDDVAEEDDEEDDEDDDDEDFDGGRGNNQQKRKKSSGLRFIDDEAQVDTDEEEEEDEDGEDDFIDGGADLQDDGGDDDRRRQMYRRPLLPREDEEQEEDVEALEKRIQERYALREEYEEDEEGEVEHQYYLPSVKDPKLWMVKCAIGHEQEVVVCLMQKCIDKGSELNIRSAIALDHLKGYVYVEADKEAHVKEACKGLRNIFASQKGMPKLVPIKEMTDVLSVENKAKAMDLCWVRIKNGTYKGDLAKVVNVDNVRQRVTVKLIPRIDLQALAVGNKSGSKGRGVVVPPPRFMNIDEARELNITVKRGRDPMTGDYFDKIDAMMFKDGFLYKKVSMKSISSQNIKPTLDEVEKFGDITANLSTLFANRKKGHFVKGDAVIVVKGDLKNLKGWVEKVEEDNVHIRPDMKGLPKTISVNEKELCKCFEPGNHVKVVSGTVEGTTGMVVKVEQHVLVILSDTNKEHIRVFADNVVESSEVITSGTLTRIGDYEIHDLVLLDNKSFGVITGVESTEACRVLMGVPDIHGQVALVKLREIKFKIDKKISVQDQNQNTVATKDVVKIVSGPCKGKQGPVQHIYGGVLFIYDRHHLEHAGFICAKANCCVIAGGSRANGARNYGAPPRSNPQLSNRFSRGHDDLVGKRVMIRQPLYKGCHGIVKEVTGSLVRVELESQTKVVTVDRKFISEKRNVVDYNSTPYRGSETPMHPSRTPMRDNIPGTTPIHDGMRTPMRDRAWNPYTPMRDQAWNPYTPSTPQYQPGSTPQYQPGTPSHTYDSSSSPYANAPSPYLPSTPNSASYLPSTPGTGGLDTMSPVIGGDNEGPYFMPDILVNVRRLGEEESAVGIVREVLMDGSCRIALGDNGETMTALPDEMDVVAPRKNDKVKIMAGAQRGTTGKLIGVDGSDGIVKVDDSRDVKIIELVLLAKLT